MYVYEILSSLNTLFRFVSHRQWDFQIPEILLKKEKSKRQEGVTAVIECLLKVLVYGFL